MTSTRAALGALVLLVGVLAGSNKEEVKSKDAAGNPTKSNTQKFVTTANPTTTLRPDKLPFGLVGRQCSQAVQLIQILTLMWLYPSCIREGDRVYRLWILGRWQYLQAARHVPPDRHMVVEHNFIRHKQYGTTWQNRNRLGDGLYRRQPSL